MTVGPAGMSQVEHALGRTPAGTLVMRGEPWAPGADYLPGTVLAACDALLDDVVRRIEEAGPELREAFAAALAGARRYCGKVDLLERTVMARCDRPPDHDGDCSWEADRIRRRYRAYEEDAAKLRNAEEHAMSLARQLASTRLELARMKGALVERPPGDARTT